jgi:hypothetical protein
LANSLEAFSSAPRLDRPLASPKVASHVAPPVPLAAVGWLTVASGLLAVACSLLRRRRPTSDIAFVAFAGETDGPSYNQQGRRPTALGAANKSVDVAPNPAMQPKTFVGELLQVALQSGLEYFDVFVKDRIEILSAERTRLQENVQHVSLPYRPLYRRINDLKAKEQRQAVEDVLYFSVMQRFAWLGMPSVQPHHLQGTVTLPNSPPDLLDRVLASPEEIPLVESHLKYVLRAVEEPITKMSKFTLFEIFGTSILFGYFLRRASQRFALTKSCQMNPNIMSGEDTRHMLDFLFEQVATTVEPEHHEWGHPQGLAEYVDTLEGTDLANTMVMSQEAGAVVQNYIRFLLGDVGEMMRQVKETLGQGTPGAGPEDQRLRLLQAVAEGQVDSIVIAAEDVWRLALEAVAFGSFLKEAETAVELTAEVPLLTPANFAALM